MDETDERTWSIGELAQASGITVRTLHHYDRLGLLVPARTESGYRSYTADDVSRLFQILALRSLGFELADVGGLLAEDSELLETTRLQLRRIDRELHLATELRTRLIRIVGALERSQRPTIDQLLDALEMMSMTVNLTRIYTRAGDDGATHLGDLSRVSKTDPRIEATGALDELNSQVGVVLTLEGVLEPARAWLLRIQNELFDVGADLIVPPEAEAKRSRLRITEDYTDRLEAACDEANAQLSPLKSFVLPGGTAAAAALHTARAICRRAERRALQVGDANPQIVRYLNRLSDLLFILARAAGAGEEPVWRPGQNTLPERPRASGV